MKTSTGSPTPLYFYLLIPLAYFLRFGYEYGSSDQDELLAYVLAFLDPELFKLDPFIQSLQESFNVRVYFTVTVAAVSTVIPLWSAVLLLHAACWIALISGLNRLASEWIQDEIPRFLAVLFILVISHKWTLGGNDLIYHALTPEPIAWALVVWAMIFFLKQRWLASGAFVGLAVWFHVLAGLLPGLVLGLCLIVDSLPSRKIKPIIHFAGTATLLSFPMLIPLAVALSNQFVPSGGPSTFYIQAVLRLSIHHMFFSFHPEMVARFFALVVGGSISFVLLNRNQGITHKMFVLVFSIGTLVLCVIGFLGTEVWESLAIARFQFFKLTVLIKALFSILIVGALWRYVPGRISVAANRVLSRKSIMALSSFVIVVVTALFSVYGIGRPAKMIQPVVHAQTPLGETEKWVRLNTPSSAVFAIPPANTTFRVGARRSVAVNWLGFPFKEPDIHFWYDRLQTAAPFAPAERPGRMGRILDDAYHAKTIPEWQKMVRELGVTHVLVDTSKLVHPLPFSVVYRQAPWQILKTLEP